MSNTLESKMSYFGVSQDRIKNYLVDVSKDSLQFAFERKFTIHAGQTGTAVPANNLRNTFDKLYAETLVNPSVIYVHIPFCQSKCTFCGFAGSRSDAEMSKKYIDTVINEIGFINSFKAARSVPIRAIYLGGGTPSSLEPADLHRLLNALKENFNLANDCEITLEGRLHDFSSERADGFLEAGFNRFSIGVQSFDTKIRKSLGRLSDTTKVVSILSDLVDRNKAAVIIDLIYGLPGQTVDKFIYDLDIAESIGVDGLDTYQLNIFKSTPLFKMLEEGKVAPAAKLQEHGFYYKAAREHLLSKKWHQLSLSHFAQTSRERNIYNPWAKRKANCIALGAGAGGSIEGFGTYTAPSVEKYFKMAAEGIYYPDAVITPVPFHSLVSEIIGSAERGYIKVESLPLGNPAVAAVLENWEEGGLIRKNGDYFDLTVSGMFWGVNITQAVIELLNLERI